MSADAPRDPGTPQAPHAEQVRRPEHHNGQQAEQGPPGQRAEDARPRQREHTPSRAEHNEARHARPPIEQAGAPPEKRDTGYSWPPPRADMNHARALYREEFGSKARADSAGPGSDRGTNVVGDKPGKSPGDTSDLPPTGADLLEMEGKDRSRGDKFRKEVDKDIGDVIDLEKTGVETVKDLMARPSPTGHPEVAVNSSSVFGPDTPQHAAVDPSAVAEMTMVVGVIAFQAGRWIHHKMERLREE